MRNERSLFAVFALAPFGLCALVFWPTLSGAFLSDDYAVLGALWDWSRQGRLLATLLSKFYSGLDSPSFYYRPLSMVSFAVNFALSGAHPLAWRLTNLALHLGCGALVFAVVRRFAIDCGCGRLTVAPSIAAAVFLLFPTSPEAVAWVSGRYDLLALAFMLATVALFQRATHWDDRWSIAALLTAACALASKESSALLPAMVAAVAIARHAARSGSAATSILFGARDASPWIVLGVAYFGMRAAIFGSPFQVYAGTSPIQALASGAWMQSMTSAGAWLDAALPLPHARMLLLIAIAMLLVLGAAACWGRRALRWAWLALAISALLSIVLLLPHLSVLASNGEQGRLFYTTSALLAMLVGLAIAAPAAMPTALHGRLRALGLGSALVLILAELPLLRATVAPWSVAGAQARAVIVALPATASEMSGARYGFVLVPDHLGSVPFGRNAQGGLIEPPIQQAPLSPRLIVQTPADLDAWPTNARRGLVDALRRYPLSQVWAAVAAGRASGLAVPTDYFCWSGAESAMVKLSLPMASIDGDWRASWRRALAASPCTELDAELKAQ